MTSLEVTAAAGRFEGGRAGAKTWSATAMGAAVGTIIAPGLGTLVGGGFGGLIGGRLGPSLNARKERYWTELEAETATMFDRVLAEVTRSLDAARLDFEETLERHAAAYLYAYDAAVANLVRASDREREALRGLDRRVHADLLELEARRQELV